MGKIHLLDKSTINKIAAGEVIERPASVVKELLENSLDANANKIIVSIKDGGKKEIVVEDNGEGMDEQDLSLCIKRHATSKIKNVEDLFRIDSFGFRGEALATIADVSYLEIESAKESFEHSNIIRVENGEILEKSIGPYFKGTKIKVRNLFYNVPARQKFLKSKAYEQREIEKVIKKIALANPNIEFLFYADKTLVFKYDKKSSVSERLMQIYKGFPTLIKGSYKDSLVELSVYITRPDLAKIGRSEQVFYINKRPVFSKEISYAIKKAYESKVSRNAKIDAFVFFNINKNLLDVNVHPQKLEVRVPNRDLLYLPVYNAIKSALENNKRIATDNTKAVQLFSDRLMQSISEKSFVKDSLNKGSTKAYKQLKKEQNTFFALTDLKKRTYRYIGQVFDTYFIIEKDGKLLFIDQHLADERYNFESLKKSSEMQELIVPIKIELSKAEIDTLKKANISFEYNIMHDGIIIKSINKIVKGLDAETIKEIIKSIANEKDIGNEKAIATIACKASVKANTSLNDMQAMSIIDKWLECENIFTCPHGRKVFFELPKEKIDKAVKRNW